MKLTVSNVAAPVCTPSRAALMTGCYPKRIDMATGSNFAVLLAGDRKGLNPKENHHRRSSEISGIQNRGFRQVASW